MSRKVVEIPVEVWEFSLQDAEHIAALHRETLRLMNENARLKAEVEQLRASSFVTAVPVEQYERVIKAGDAMAKRTEFFQKRWDADELCQEVEAWNAAKEGKQP